MSLERNTWDSFVIYGNVFLRAWNLIYMYATDEDVLYQYTHSSGYQIFHFEKNKNTTNSKDTVIILTVFGLSALYVRSKFLSYDLLHDFCFFDYFFLYLFLLYGVKCMKECVWLLLFCLVIFFYWFLFLSISSGKMNEKIHGKRDDGCKL